MAGRRMWIIGLVAIMMLIAGAGNSDNVVAQSPDQNTGDENTLVGHFGETWTGGNTTAGLIVDNRTGTAGGDGLRGLSKSTLGYFAGVTGINSSSGTGVYGKSTGGGSGVYGYSVGKNTAGVLGKNAASTGGAGVKGITTSNNGTAIYGDAAGEGTAVLGSSDSGTGVYGGTNDDTHAGVYALNGGTGPGVDVLSGGIGVNSLSTNSNGVVGTTWNNNTSGVKGVSTLYAGYGVSGESASLYGMYAQGPDAWGDDAGDILLGGTLGEIATWSNVLYLGSHNNVIVDLDNNNDNAGACLYIRDGTDGDVTHFCEASANAPTIVTTGSQASAVQTQSDGQRLMYAVEGTGVWVEDVGSATLMNGELVVTFDPVYAQTASLSQAYQVFVTATCDQPVLLYVSEKTSTGFTVKGTNLDGSASSCSFDYRVVASRAGYESVRLEEYTPAELDQP